MFKVDGRDVEHHVSVKLNGFDIMSNEFEVVRGDQNVLSIAFERLPVTTAAKPPSYDTGVALRFDGQKNYVTIPTLTYDGSHPITLEAIARLDETSDTGHLISDSHMAGIFLGYVFEFGQVFPGGAAHNGKNYFFARDSAPWEIGRTRHLATVFDGKRVRLFVDGKFVADRQFNGEYKPTGLPFSLGNSPDRKGPADGHAFKGRVYGIRISNSARYTNEFKPPPKLSKDKDTLALYKIDEGAGEVLHDASGNDHHGKIAGAKWLLVDKTPQTFARDAITPDGGWVDLLPLIDPARDLLKARTDKLPGKLERLKQGFRVSNDPTDAKFGMVQIPVAVDGHYRLRLKVSSIKPVELRVALPAGMWDVKLRLLSGSLNLQPIDKQHQNAVPADAQCKGIPLNKPFDLDVEVRPFGEQVQIIVHVNAEEVPDWTGAQDRLYHDYELRDPLTLGLISWNDKPTIYELHSLQLQMLDGEATLLRPWEAWKAGLASSPTEILTSPDWEWTEPEPIEELNSDGVESGPTVSADRLTMVFGYYGGPGSQPVNERIPQLWISERKSVNDPWGQRQKVGLKIDREERHSSPELSSDGLTLIFTRDSNVKASEDLFVTTRPTRTSPWGKAVSLGPPINMPDLEEFPSLSVDGLSLLFSSPRPGGIKDARRDLWISRRAAVDEPWAEPICLDIPATPMIVNGNEFGSSLSADGLKLLYSGGKGFIATRDSLESPWNKPIQLPASIQTDREGDMELSADGREVYFSLDGDRYVVRRVPK